MDKLLWETLTHRPHPTPIVCNHTISKVREIWRQSIFELMKGNRVSMRPFLSSLKECKDMILEETPYWTSCLNDP